MWAFALDPGGSGCWAGVALGRAGKKETGLHFEAHLVAGQRVDWKGTSWGWDVGAEGRDL